MTNALVPPAVRAVAAICSSLVESSDSGWPQFGIVTCCMVFQERPRD